MNIFILSTGRCGSTTFIKACQHITNYSSAHESRSHLLGPEHFQYPDDHIEADNRLTWHLGRLDKYYGDKAIYVHQIRNIDDTAKSFVKRYNNGVIKAYRKGMMKGLPKASRPDFVARDYYETVNANIELFLKDKSRTMQFALENAKEDFKRFWELIGAEGNLDAAIKEFDTNYNYTDPNRLNGMRGYLRRKVKKLRKAMIGTT